jgi:plasmid maintenance system antidote protein VapI
MKNISHPGEIIREDMPAVTGADNSKVAELQNP